MGMLAGTGWEVRQGHSMRGKEEEEESSELRQVEERDECSWMYALGSSLHLLLCTHPLSEPLTVIL